MNQELWDRCVAVGFAPGRHEGATPGVDPVCVMEAVAAATGEDITDFPKCVSPCYAVLFQEFNDIGLLPAESLAEFAKRSVGTANWANWKLAKEIVWEFGRAILLFVSSSLEMPIYRQIFEALLPDLVVLDRLASTTGDDLRAWTYPITHDGRARNSSWAPGQIEQFGFMAASECLGYVASAARYASKASTTSDAGERARLSVTACMFIGTACRVFTMTTDAKIDSEEQYSRHVAEILNRLL